MDKSKSQVPHKNMKPDMNAKRPENKDNLDSRQVEEQHLKGEDVTHNRKEHKSENKKTK